MKKIVCCVEKLFVMFCEETLLLYLVLVKFNGNCKWNKI